MTALAERAWIRASRHPAAATAAIALLAFLLNAYLISSSFVPNLGGIGTWDEAGYVHSGRMLLQGQWPSYAGNPLVALLYALTYLPYSRSDFWFVHSTSLGRMILFALLWLSGYSVATQLKRWTHPLIVVGLFFISSIPLALLSFPSDPLFAAMAAFSFWKLLRFRNEGRIVDLAWSSGFLALAALARNDGLVMAPVLIVLAALFSYRKRRSGAAVLAAAAPFLILVFGYVFIRGVATGDFRLGTAGRAYDNFEAGQQIVFSGQGAIDPVLESKLEARRLFGTAVENQGSVARAILRNPSAYWERVRALARQLPAGLLEAYGQRTAAILFLLGMWGAAELWRRGERGLLLLFLLWPAHLLTGWVITIFRSGHLQFPFYALYGMAGIGLTALLERSQESRVRLGWVVVIVVALGVSTLLWLPAVQFGLIVLAAALALVFGLRGWLDQVPRGAALSIAGLIFLGGGLLLHGDYSGPKRRILGERPDEQAVVFLERNYEPGTRIAAASPGPVYAARMTYMGLSSLDVPLDLEPEAFVEWMRRQGIRAVLVEYGLTYTNPGVWDRVSASIGEGLAPVFSAGEGDFQVLAVQEE